MDKEYRNIYQIARESAGLTQEKASELMDISVDSLRAYESGRRIPPDHVVIKMIEIYNTQYLAYQHLKTSAEVGQKYLPDIKIKDLSTAILNLQAQVGDYISCEKLLVKIGSDGKVSDDEAFDFKKICKELDDVFEAIMTFKFSK
ncbi:helix-turn-helix domain-containing protein [Clostridium tyrobutyricum]|uniref:helix-turn-helix domain-containing protein n=1 Tax=Clostridium tyrobutyricum TaxID=1519 RepID=UPI001C38AB58|nr:helix-turn-helix transcriptional regulator [Clostridium tyrobutyricum]MBV4423453.1 helix-turn-helix transcriptional regulator [Clostridium tyrobutyricum]